MAVAWAGPDGRWDPETAAVRAVPASATPGGGNPDAPFALDGTAAFVIDGEQAETFLVAAQDADGISLFEVDAHADGVRRAATPTMDLTRRLSTVEFAAAPGRRLAAGSAPAALATARDAAWVALAAEQAGAAAQLLADTVAYSKVRVQFGRPIGSFQALKHRMADLHVLVEPPGRPSCAAAADVDPRRWPGVLLRGVPHRRRRGHPAARRHRDHVGARRPPVLQAGPRQRGAVRIGRRASATSGPARRAR